MQGGVRVVRAIEFPLSCGTEYVPAGRAAARTLLPVLALSSLLIVMRHLLGQPLAVFADSQGAWFSWSHLLLALAFVATQLTNRRYGPDYAFAQIVLSLGICGVILIVLPAQSLPAASLPTTREGMAFVVAFLASGLLSIIAFEGYARRAMVAAAVDRLHRRRCKLCVVVLSRRLCGFEFRLVRSHEGSRGSPCPRGRCRSVALLALALER